MLHSGWMFAVIFAQNVAGLPLLPLLTVKDGCFLATEGEVEVFALEDEAIILSCPIFDRVLEVRNIAPPNANYIITKDNGTEGVSFQGEGRVQQRDKQLRFLPAQASDSGLYICTYRNETYCVTGNITLTVYEARSVVMEKVTNGVEVLVGENLRYACPSLDDFNDTETLIVWNKDSKRGGPFSQLRGRLIIPAVRRSHAGLYTCRLTVTIDGRPYKVSRSIALIVRGVDPETPSTPSPTLLHLSSTSHPETLSSSTVHTPANRPPVIVSRKNETVFEILHGSGLELFCKVLTGCQTAESTVVTWLVNGQSVESSYLAGRALQGGRRVTRESEVCQVELRLLVEAMTDEDVNMELKCVAQNEGGRQEVVALLQLEDSSFTWLVVAVVAASCFLTVVSIFLYVLFKPKRTKKMDYFLARQNSTF
ncbi:interleukin-1 receptor type 2 isoform X2 [Pseudochaenichthys georgianus]|uniref:interleukin-1 receptor type 2 isoform X2 n=1 Tax=Pseudochaenichthys georgianus TaxID=52239 RepID=UPI00146F6427|nr:interleukin-1 receptor type 2 isoform X2 [Pseudochaenichthys georgianus]